MAAWRRGRRCGGGVGGSSSLARHGDLHGPVLLRRFGGRGTEAAWGQGSRGVEGVGRRRRRRAGSCGRPEATAGGPEAAAGVEWCGDGRVRGMVVDRVPVCCSFLFFLFFILIVFFFTNFVDCLLVLANTSIY